MQVWGTCLGHQLQMILTANVDFNDLLITTDAVVSCADTTWAMQSSSCTVSERLCVHLHKLAL